MAFSTSVLGLGDIGNFKICWGTWNAASVTTGTVDIRGTLGGSAVKVPYRVITGGVTNSVSATAPNVLFSENGTMAITATSNDTGTFFFLLQ